MFTFRCRRAERRSRKSHNPNSPARRLARNDGPLGVDSEASEHERPLGEARGGGTFQGIHLRGPQWRGHHRFGQNPDRASQRLRLHWGHGSAEGSVHVREYQPAFRRDLRADDKEDWPLQHQPELRLAHRRLPPNSFSPRSSAPATRSSASLPRSLPIVSSLSTPRGSLLLSLRPLSGRFLLWRSSIPPCRSMFTSVLANRFRPTIPCSFSTRFVNLITKTFLLEQRRFGSVAKEDSAAAIPSSDDASKLGNQGEEVKRIEGSKSGSLGLAADEVLVLPYESLTPFSEDGVEIKELLEKLVVLKFNGSLGTAMGFNGPRSAIEVHNGFTLLDLIVNQIEVLEKYPKSNIVMLNSSDGQTNENESCPSDHDMMFLSLMKSGTLDVLLSQGKEYILVVGSDNVAAVIDPKILNHLIQNKIEYCMEVTPTTSFGKDGVSNSNQQKFQLAEIGRNSASHSMDKFKFVDTRNLWVNLRATKRLMDTDALKFENYSKARETAAGSTVQFFDHAIGISVPQTRFLPINGTSNLLILQSDLFTVKDGILVRNTARRNPVNPVIDLGPEFGQVSDFPSRFKSIPSVIELDSLKVTGDVWFGTDIILKGRVNVAAEPGTRLEIPDGAVLHDKDIRNPMDI